MGASQEQLMGAMKLAHEANDIAAVNELAQMLDDLAPVEKPPALAEGAVPTPTFGERMGNTFREGLGNTADALTGIDVQTDGSPYPGQDPAGRVSRALTKGVIPAAGNMVMDAVTTTFNQVAPETGKAIGDTMRDVATSAPAQAVGRGLDAAKQASPELYEAVTQGATLGSLGMGTPAVPRSNSAHIFNKIAPGKRNPDKVARTADFLEPDHGTGYGDYTFEGGLKTQKYKPTPQETHMYNRVAKVPGFKPDGTYTENFAALERFVSRTHNDLNKVLIKAKPVLADDVLAQLDEAQSILGKQSLLVGSAEDAGNKVFTVLQEKLAAVTRKDGTISMEDLMKVRIDLDKAVKKTYGQNFFTSDTGSAAKLAVDEMRETLNRVVTSKVPGAAKALDDQSQALRAMGITEPRLVMDRGNMLTRFVRNLERSTGVSHPRTPVAIGVAAQTPEVGVMGAALATLVAGKRVLTAPARTSIHKMLGMADSIINKGGKLGAQMQADKLIILDLMARDRERYREEQAEGKPQASIDKESLVYAGVADPWTTKNGKAMGERISSMGDGFSTTPSMNQDDQYLKQGKGYQGSKVNTQVLPDWMHDLKDYAVGVHGSSRDSWTNRLERLAGDNTAYKKGEINAGEVALRTGGETIGALGDVVGAAVEPLIPQFVLDAIGTGAGLAMDTEAGRKALKWLEENPRAARNLAQAGNLASVLPAGAAAGSIGRGAMRGTERVLKNFPIELPRFYAKGGGKAGQLAAAATVVPSAMKNAITEFVDPRGIARSEQGISNQTRNVARMSQEGKEALKNKGLLDTYTKEVEVEEASVAKAAKARAKDLERRAKVEADYNEGLARNRAHQEALDSGSKRADAPPKASKGQQKLIDMAPEDRDALLPKGAPPVMSREFPYKSKEEVARLKKASRAAQSSAEVIQEKILRAFSKLTGRPYKELDAKGTSQYDSFASGQLEYANLMEQQLNRGTRESPKVLRDLFNDLGIIESGQFSRETFKKAFTEYKPEMWKGVVDDELIDTLTDIMDKAWQPGKGMKLLGGDKNGKLMIIKHPNMWDDFTQESRVAGSELNAIFNSKRITALAGRAFGERGAGGRLVFKDPQELRLFAALDSLASTENKKVLDDAAVEFLRSRSRLKRGLSITKEQQTTYDAALAKLEQRAASFKVDSQGRVYRKSNHNSASKTMGGVQNTTVFDQQGNIINLIHDEHDLFGLNLPWMSRMINISAPQVTNVFRGSKNIVEPLDAAKRAEFILKMQDEYGATGLAKSADKVMKKTGEVRVGETHITKSNRADALEQGILNFQPKVNAGHVYRSAIPQLAELNLKGGLLAQYDQENRETQRKRRAQ